MPASTPGRLRRLPPALLAVTLLIVGGYVGWKYGSYHWHLRAAERAERDRDFAAAARHLAKCLADRPDEPEARLLAARVGWRSRVGRPLPPPGWDAAVRRDLKAAEADPRLIDRVGVEEHAVDALAGRLAAAEGPLARRVLDGDPDAVPILEALTWASIVEHRFPAAAQAVNALLDRRPDHADGHYWRGLIRELTHGATGRPDADYRRAAELAPGNFEYRLRLAHALARNTDTKAEALAVFDALATERPDDPDVLVGRGGCQLDLGDPAAARATLEKAVRLRPGDGGGLSEYGRAVLACGDPAAAEPVLRRAVALAPRSRAANHALGTCLGALGRDAEAKPYLAAAEAIFADAQRVHELSRELFANPSAGPGPRCELGELLLRTGHDQLGRYWLESALAADPGYEPARRALARGPR
jgi:hypothetical protein